MGASPPGVARAGPSVAPAVARRLGGGTRRVPGPGGAPRAAASTPARVRVVPGARARASIRGARAPTVATPRDVRARGFLDDLLAKAKGEDPAKNEQTPSDAAEKDAAGASEETDETRVAEPSSSSESSTLAAAAAAAPPAPKPAMPKMPDAASTVSALDALLPPDPEAARRAAEEAADDKRAAELDAARAAKAKAKAKAAETTTTTSVSDLEPAAKDANEEPSDASDASKDGPSVSISPNALRALQEAEKARASGGKAKDPGSEEEWLDSVVDGLSDSARKDAKERTAEENAELEKVLEDLSRLAKKDASERDSEEIRAKFDSLFEILEESDASPAVSKEDVEALKKEVFGFGTFYVTSVEDLGPEIMGEGTLIKGNLRADRAVVWEKVQEGVERLFGSKYEVFMLEEPGFAGGDDDRSSGGGDSDNTSRGPRVSFLLVPGDKAGPNPNTSAWQYVVAIALFGLTAGSALQLGLVAEVSRLPRETMDWLAAGSQGLDTSLAPGELPPGLEGFDSAAYVAGAFPVFGGIFAAAFAHEVGHSVAAAARNVKISVPFLIPNGQLGTFGSITQIKSVPRTREDLFDVAIAGPIAGGTVAGTLFAYGLALSAAGAGGDASVAGELLPVPAELFNGSLLLGSIAELVLGAGPGEAARTSVAVHPLFIAGWCVRRVFPRKRVLFVPLSRRRRDGGVSFFFRSRGTLVEASGDDEIPTSRTAATRRWRFTLTGYAKRFAARPVEAHFHDTEDARRESFERARNPAARTRLPSRLRPELRETHGAAASTRRAFFRSLFRLTSSASFERRSPRTPSRVLNAPRA